MDNYTEKQKLEIAKALKSPKGIGLVKAALSEMLEFWSLKREIEKLVESENIPGVGEFDGIDDLFFEIGMCGAMPEDDKCIREQIDYFVENL